MREEEDDELSEEDCSGDLLGVEAAGGGDAVEGRSEGGGDAVAVDDFPEEAFPERGEGEGVFPPVPFAVPEEDFVVVVVAVVVVVVVKGKEVDEEEAGDKLAEGFAMTTGKTRLC